MAEAISYYHRAIYGRWSRRSAPNRIRQPARADRSPCPERCEAGTVAELLPLEGLGVTDTALQRRMAHLYVQAGSAARGAAIFRGLLQLSPRDADALTGLGGAEFTMEVAPPPPPTIAVWCDWAAARRRCADFSSSPRCSPSTRCSAASARPTAAASRRAAPAFAGRRRTVRGHRYLGALRGAID